HGDRLRRHRTEAQEGDVTEARDTTEKDPPARGDADTERTPARTLSSEKDTPRTAAPAPAIDRTGVQTEPGAGGPLRSAEDPARGRALRGAPRLGAGGSLRAHRAPGGWGDGRGRPLPGSVDRPRGGEEDHAPEPRSLGGGARALRARDAGAGAARAPRHRPG